MPLRGEGHSRLTGDERPYFDSLAELDAWCAQPRDKLIGVLPYQPRPRADGQTDSRGKLLVCHDYKGGYNEAPSGLSYTFNFWPLCETFIYFSHHRVTIPPSGWTNAAHKQGARMLSTLIFEHAESAPDCLQLIVGEPECKIKDKIPLSRRYAVLLAQIAYQRGFDGYLLNFEFRLQHGSEQARALAAWILILREELRAQVGPHAQAVWYDSIVVNGKLAWQDRLNSFNLPFFLASDTFFTNYTWRPQFPALSAQYFLSLDPTLLGPTLPTLPTVTPQVKTLQSIYTGVDVWGRNQYGGGGFGSYRAITRIDPEFLGLSVAFFAPAWTWESEENTPGWNWDKWWDYERKLWLGPADPSEIVPVPPAEEGPFKPMTAFFQAMSSPDPVRFAFYTSFSPGVGYSWFVQGEKVLETVKGWTDVDKQGAIGNLVWPRPNPVWEGDSETLNNLPAPLGSSSLDMSDGYNGGNTLKLSLTFAGTDAEDAFFRCIWVPVQSLSVTSQTSYEATVVCKTSVKEDLMLDLGIHIRSLSKDANSDVKVTSGQVTQTDLPNGWTEQTIAFTALSKQPTASIAIGFIIGLATEDPTTACPLSLSLGQLAVYPFPPSPNIAIGTPSISKTKFTPASTTAPDTCEGTLTWDIISAFVPAPIRIGSPEDPNPAWLLSDSPSGRFPRFTYFNIYVSPLDRHAASIAPVRVGTGTFTNANVNAVFVGTTGLDGRAGRFYVEKSVLPEGLEKKDGVRFYVQGVTDRGVVMPLETCGVVEYWWKGVKGVMNV